MYRVVFEAMDSTGLMRFGLINTFSVSEIWLKGAQCPSDAVHLQPHAGLLDS